MANIRMEVVKDGGWHRYMVTFANARQAINWIASHDGMVTWLQEIEGDNRYPLIPFGPIDPDVMELLDILYPSCHHGMSADLCMDPVGPNHFGTMEQELAGLL